MSPETPAILHVVLHQPEIPPNTGNIGRTCAAVGAKLWLVRPLGFQMDEKALRRAGMDYWPLVDCEVVEDWAQLRERLDAAPLPENAERPREFWLLTKFAERIVWEARFQPGDALVFGSETKGLPESLRSEHAEQCLKLPMRPAIRSLNLASTANTVVYEAIRQFGGLPPS